MTTTFNRKILFVHIRVAANFSISNDKILLSNATHNENIKDVL